MKRKRPWWQRFLFGVLLAVIFDLVGVTLLFVTTWYIGAIVWVMLCLGATGVPLVDDDWVTPLGFWLVQILLWMAWLLGFWTLVGLLGRTYLQQPVSGQ